MMGRMSRWFSVPCVAGAVAGSVLLGGALTAQPTMQRLPNPGQIQAIRSEVAAPVGAQGFALFKKGPVALGAGSGGAGLNPGWIARLDLPNGKYVVSASVRFTRDSPNSRLPFDEGTPPPDTAGAECELGGLDQTATADFYIEAAYTSAAKPSVTIPFDTAGTSTGGGVYLRCTPSGQVSASHIAITAVKVADLTVRSE